MPDPIDALSQRWKQNPDAPSTIALCEALRGTSRPTLVQQVGEIATQKHGTQVPVLLAVARMYLDSQRLSDAQAVLVTAGKVAPRDGGVYRWLGEVLLRRGDAERAEKVLERATQLGSPDPDTSLWLERARVFKVVQAKAGARAVAMEIAAAAVQPPKRKPVDAMGDDEGTTEVRHAVDLGIDPDRTGKYVKEAETMPFPTPVEEIKSELNFAHRRAQNHAPDDLIPERRGRDERPEPPTNHVDSPTVALTPAPPPPRAREPDPFFPPQREAAPEVAPVRPHAPPPPVSRRDPARDARPAAPAQRSEGPPGVPNAKDVLDALSLAGVFEKDGAMGTVFRWDKPTEKSRKRTSIVLGVFMAALLGVGYGIFWYVNDVRKKDHDQAEAILQTVEADIQTSRAAVLPDVEKRLAHAFELDSRSPRAAVDWLHERALVGIIKNSTEVAFEDSMARAKEVEVPEQNYAFARVAAFLFQGDTAGAAGLMSKWDGPAASDAWYQVMTGATLERAGDPRATERYAAAVKLAPDLVIAQILLAQSTALEVDPVKAAELGKQFRSKYPDRPEGSALVALAWARDPARGEQPPPEVADMAAHATDLPLPLATVPHALAAISSIDKHDVAAAKGQIEQGLAVTDGPGVASWLGSIALDTRDEALVQKAALSAVGFSAVYPPARVLAARVALLGGRFDQALKATEDMDANSPDVAVVRAATAYERLDVDNLGRALDALSPEAKKLPFMSALEIAPDVLLGRASAAQGPKILEMSNDEAPWSDLVAMDLALDVGELEVAEKIAATWKGSEDKPLRALRLSRLARYQNKIDAADALSKTALDSGTVTQRTLQERVFVLVAKNKPQEVAPLLAKYPIVQQMGPSATWLSAYALASANKTSEAIGKTSSLDPPPAGAPLPARVIAAVALATMKDKKRAIDYVKALLSTGVQDPDLVAAGMSLGFRRVDHAKRRATYE
jgi:hypothetical protein